MKKALCSITKKELPVDDLVIGSTIRKQLFSLIKDEHPDFSDDQFISKTSLAAYRKKYLEDIIVNEMGELSKLEEEVIKAVGSDQLLAENIEIELETELTQGQKLADKIAEFGGSWTFIIFFFSFILVWMAVNIFILSSSKEEFDPYPFILLNLVLSCLAAIQAPIIMMSQNRREQKDRARSEHDYKVNLKAELEIRLLHEKMDHLMIHQSKRLLEIQELQMDYLEEISTKNKGDIKNKTL